MNRSFLVCFFATAALASTPSPAVGAQLNPEPRVGVYDSRAVSYSYYWSPPVKHDRDELVARARAAKAAGDGAHLKVLTARIDASQKQSMLEVFSTAPAEEAMTSLADQMSAILGELGVSRLVSKWDEAGLKDVPVEDRVDATERLVRAFFPSPDGHLSNTLKGIEAAKPLPLWEAKLMCLFQAL